jgi:hypothetical protein
VRHDAVDADRHEQYGERAEEREQRRREPARREHTGDLVEKSWSVRPEAPGDKQRGAQRVFGGGFRSHRRSTGRFRTRRECENEHERDGAHRRSPRQIPIGTTAGPRPVGAPHGGSADLKHRHLPPTQAIAETLRELGWFPRRPAADEERRLGPRPIEGGSGADDTTTVHSVRCGTTVGVSNGDMLAKVFGRIAVCPHVEMVLDY